MADGEKFITDYLSDQHPELDIRPGTGIRDLLVVPHSGLVERLIQDIAQVKNEFDLTQADTMDPDILDNRGSNWFVKRKLGRRSRGFVRIVLNAEQDFNIAEGHRFTYGTANLIFLASDSQIILKSDLSPSSTTGEWFIDINVEAIEDGDQYNIIPGDFTNFDPIISEVVRVESVETFTQGITPETNQAYFDRLQNAITVRNLINAPSIRAVMLNEENLDTQDIYIAGFGAPEQWRDFVTGDLGSFHIGNKTDIYVKQRLVTKTKNFTVQTGGMIVFDIEDLPIYRITMFKDDNTAIPALQFNTDFLARFSKREDPFLLTTEPTGTVIPITFESMNIDSADLFVGQSDNRVVLADLLVKGLAPLYVSIAVQYTLKQGAIPFDEDLAANLIIEYIHNIAIGGAPEASDIDSLLRQNFSSIERVVMPINIEGELHSFDNIVSLVSSTDILLITENISKSLSRNTIMYIPQTITVSLS